MYWLQKLVWHGEKDTDVRGEQLKPLKRKDVIFLLMLVLHLIECMEEVMPFQHHTPITYIRTCRWLLLVFIVDISCIRWRFISSSSSFFSTIVWKWLVCWQGNRIWTDEISVIFTRKRVLSFSPSLCLKL